MASSGSEGYLPGSAPSGSLLQEQSPATYPLLQLASSCMSQPALLNSSSRIISNQPELKGSTLWREQVSQVTLQGQRI